jgi:hypothetical protein
MKSFTRLANAITETPDRPGTKDKPSERQQGDSKRGKIGGNNYYEALNNMFHVTEPENRRTRKGKSYNPRTIMTPGQAMGLR